MTTVFPPSGVEYDSWLQSHIRKLVETEALELAEEIAEVGEMTVYASLPDLPANVVVFRSGPVLVHSLLPPAVKEALLSGDSVLHFPVITGAGIKILDENGDNITSLYFPHRILLKMSDLEIVMTTNPSLVFIRATILDYEFNSPKVMYYEILVDDEETMLYRSLSAYKTCTVRDGKIYLRVPGTPEIQLRPMDNKVFAIGFENLLCREVQGLLYKITIQSEPFPYFMFCMNEAQCDGQVYDELEIPSFYLYDWSTLKKPVLSHISRELSKQRVAKLRGAREIRQKDSVSTIVSQP